MLISSVVIPVQAGIHSEFSEIHFEFLAPLDSVVRRKNSDFRRNDGAWLGHY